jgi:hypothetical protein
VAVGPKASGEDIREETRRPLAGEEGKLERKKRPPKDGSLGGQKIAEGGGKKRGGDRECGEEEVLDPVPELGSEDGGDHGASLSCGCKGIIRTPSLAG